MKIIRIPGYLYDMLTEYAQPIDVLLDEVRLRTIVSELDVSKYRLLNHPVAWGITDTDFVNFGNDTSLYNDYVLTNEDRILLSTLKQDVVDPVLGRATYKTVDVVPVGDYLGIVYYTEVKNNTVEEFYERAFEILKVRMSGIEISKTRLFDSYVNSLGRS